MNTSEYQFGSGYDRHYPVSQETGIDHSDYKSQMHVESFDIQRRGWQPPFAVDDIKLRKVFLRRGWRYVHGSALPPESIDWLELDKQATALSLKFGFTISPDASACQHEQARLHREHVPSRRR